MKWTLDVQKTLEDFQKRLIDLTNDWKEAAEDFAGKPAEPAISIHLDNDMKWSAEIYSYILNFDDGTRHHFFNADTLPQLLNEIDAAIIKERFKLEEWKKTPRESIW